MKVGRLRSPRRRGTELASAVMVLRAQVLDMSRRRYSAPEVDEALAIIIWMQLSPQWRSRSSESVGVRQSLLGGKS